MIEQKERVKRTEAECLRKGGHRYMGMEPNLERGPFNVLRECFWCGHIQYGRVTDRLRWEE